MGSIETEIQDKKEILENKKTKDSILPENLLNGDKDSDDVSGQLSLF